MNKLFRRFFVIVWLSVRKSARVLLGVALLCLSLVLMFVAYQLMVLPAEKSMPAPGPARPAPFLGSHQGPVNSAASPSQSASLLRQQQPRPEPRDSDHSTSSKELHPFDLAPPVDLRADDSGGVVRPPRAPAVDTEKIFLVMSAFRDGQRCARTIGFALSRAKNPDRIHFRVMQALNEQRGDRSCAKEFAEKQLIEFCQKRAEGGLDSCKVDVLSRMRVWTIPPDMGQGPAHQRGLLNEVRDHEDPDSFCINTDSHMDFHEQWDELMIKEWIEIDNEFAVTTAYPMRMMPNQDAAFAHSHVDLCGWFLEAGIPRGQGGDNLRSPQNQKPYLTFNWAAGFSFGKCHMDRNVPVDKHLQWVFTGEEVDRAVRLWTSGYDLYLPAFTYIYHDYDHAKQDFWSFSRDPHAQGRSRQRIQHKLNMSQSARDEPPPSFGIFGLGGQRSMEQYVEWTRVNLGTEYWSKFLKSKGLEPLSKEQKVQGPHWYCQTLKRVPVKSSQALRESIRVGGLPAKNERFVPKWDPSSPEALPVMPLDQNSGL